MADELESWRELGLRLGIKVVAPATVLVADEPVTFTALLPQFGSQNGMIADPDWERIRSHAMVLAEQGYGYSAVSLGNGSDDESAQEMLRDWGWSAAEPTPKWWEAQVRSGASADSPLGGRADIGGSCGRIVIRSRRAKSRR